MPIYVLAGEEDFELDRRVTELKQKLLDPAWASINFLRVENASLVEIVDLAASLPFGPGNKVILVDKCELFTKKRRKAGSDDEPEKKPEKASESKKKNELDIFEQALKTVADNTNLILACPHNFDSSLKTSKVIAKITSVETFEKERYFAGSRNPKLEAWCRKEAKRFAATISDEAIGYVLDGTEANLRQVSSELQKAATSILPATHITLDVLVNLSPHYSHVFTLIDRWLTGRHEESLVSLSELLSRQSAMPIIATIQTMLSKWIQMKAICGNVDHDPRSKRQELSFPELVRKVASELRLMPFVVEKDLKRLSTISEERLIEKKIQLTQLEYLIKTGQTPEKHALEVFITT